MEVSKVLGEVVDVVEGEIKDEVKSIFQKIKRWLLFALIAYAAILTVAVIISIRDNTNLLDGLEAATDTIIRLEESSLIASVAVGGIASELSKANVIIEDLRETNTRINNELDRIGKTSEGVGDRASDLDDISRGFEEIFTKYNTGSEEIRKSE